MHKSHWKATAPFGLAIFLAVGAASADTKQYSGVGCLPGFSSNSWNINGNYFQSTTSGGAIAVYCPLVRDQVSGSNGPSGTMWVNDPNSTDSVTCTLRAQNSTGTVTSFTSASTTGPQVGDATLTFGAITSGTGNGDQYAFRCTLPTNGRIYAYRLVENAQTE